MFGDASLTPKEYLLWFHHLPWTHQLKNGKNLWENLALKYQKGVDEVKEMVRVWQSVKKYLDNERFNSVDMMLKIQLKEAKWWRDACLLYFQKYSNMPLPKGVEKPNKTLEEFKQMHFPFAPGN